MVTGQQRYLTNFARRRIIAVEQPIVIEEVGQLSGCSVEVNDRWRAELQLRAPGSRWRLDARILQTSVIVRSSCHHFKC